MEKEQKGSNPRSIPTQENCSKPGSLRVGQSNGKDEGAGEKLSQSKGSLHSLLSVWCRAIDHHSLRWLPGCSLSLTDGLQLLSWLQS